MDNIEKLIDKLKLINLLYVEDNEESRQSTLTLFEDIFTNITVAIDGEDGVKKFTKGKFDLIITDISMPNMDGLEMAKEIRKIDKNINIIVLTALKDLKTVTRAIEIGIDYFINKPLEDIDILFDKLYKVLQKIEYVQISNEKDKIQKEQEKLDLALKMLQLIGHHWRQPLSVIMSIASSEKMFKTEGDKYTIQDLENTNIIIDNINKLSRTIKEIENFNFENSSVEEIEKMISISNKLYESDLNNG